MFQTELNYNVFLNSFKKLNSVIAETRDNSEQNSCERSKYSRDLIWTRDCFRFIQSNALPTELFRQMMTV